MPFYKGECATQLLKNMGLWVMVIKKGNIKKLSKEKGLSYIHEIRRIVL